MKIWIARDRDNDLRVFTSRPYQRNGIFMTEFDNDDFIFIDSGMFPELTFENSPQEVEFKLAQEMNVLDLFKKLPHLNDNKEVVDDWGYTPNLYHFDTKWHVSWMHCDDGFAFIDFEGETPEEAIQKAFDWCIELKLIK